MIADGDAGRIRDFLASVSGSAMLETMREMSPKLSHDGDTIERAALRAKEYSGYHKAIDNMLALAGQVTNRSEASGHRDVR